MRKGRTEGDSCSFIDHIGRFVGFCWFTVIGSDLGRGVTGNITVKVQFNSHNEWNSSVVSLWS